MEAERWTVLNMPAIAEEGDVLGRKVGEPLWPLRYGLEVLQQIKKTLGSYFFHALYQQRPSPEDGNVYKRIWFRYARIEDGYIRLIGNGIVPDKFVSLRDCRRFGIADLAFTTKTSSDYTITSAWAVDQESNLILLDIERDRLEGPDILPAIKRMGDKWDVDYFGVEANAAQIAVVQAGKRAGMTIRALYADKDKFTRAQAASVRFEGGQVFLPDGHDQLGAFEHELLSFPNAAHDDMVDVTSWACAEVQRRGPAGESQSQKLVRELLEAAAAQKEQEEWMRIDNPAFWNGTVDS